MRLRVRYFSHVIISSMTIFWSQTPMNEFSIENLHKTVERKFSTTTRREKLQRRKCAGGKVFDQGSGAKFSSSIQLFTPIRGWRHRGTGKQIVASGRATNRACSTDSVVTHGHYPKKKRKISFPSPLPQLGRTLPQHFWENIIKHLMLLPPVLATSR